MSARYSMSKKGRKAEQKKVKNYLGRVIRNIDNKKGDLKNNSKLFQALLRAKLIYNQQRTDKNKIYSWHEDVSCISKGKAHKKYEFGCKVGFVVSSRSNFVLGAKSFDNNPYDGHTLKSNLEQAERLSGKSFRKVYVDQGYKGHGIKDKNVIVARTRKKTLSILQKKYQKRRNAIEPVIGHIKNDGSRGAICYLKGKMGDNMNAIATAMGFNLRKLLNCIDSYLFTKIQMVIFVIKSIFLRKNTLFII